ncbi:ABC transporter ATP-binding protein [Buchananella felis]|uniref:ABC transporter ATP-binding protein n=1 Tax=Buchananella felis TaxID=3231492 RepID=UPI003527132A
MANVLRLVNVDFTRARNPILRGVNWEVREGERWVVLGPNGAGKTTIMRMLAAREHPSAGTVEVLGQRLGAVDVWELRSRIGFVSSAMINAIVPGDRVLNVVINGAFGSTGRTHSEVEELDVNRARDLLEVLGISALAERAFFTLSTGEKQRVCIARALMPDPELLVLDEPATGLDLGGREQLLSALNELASFAGAPAMVIVTHHVEEIPPGTTHALLLREGRVAASGLVAQVLTSEHLSTAFGIPLLVEERRGRFLAVAAQARPGGRHAAGKTGEARDQGGAGQPARSE